MLAPYRRLQTGATAAIACGLVWLGTSRAEAGGGGGTPQLSIERAPTCEPSRAQKRRWRALASAQPRSAQLYHLRVRLNGEPGGYVGNIEFAQGQGIEVAADTCGALVAELDEYLETLWPTPPRWRLGVTGGYRLGIFRESAWAGALNLSRSRRSWAFEFSLRYSGGWLSLPEDLYGPDAGRIGVHQVSLAGALNYLIRGRSRAVRIPLGVGLELATLTLVGDQAFAESPRYLEARRGFFPALLVGVGLAHVPVRSPANFRLGLEFWCTLPALASLTFAGSSSSDRYEPEHGLENLTAGVRFDVGFEIELRRLRAGRAWAKPGERPAKE